MFDEKEIEELRDEFLSLDGNVFLESVGGIGKLEAEVLPNNVNINLFKKLPNLKNNNFIGDTLGVDLDEPDASTHLDLINENSFSLGTFEHCKSSENTTGASELGKFLQKAIRPDLVLDKKEDEIDNEYKEIDEKLTSPDIPVVENCFHRNGWPADTLGLWRSGPSSLNLDQPCRNPTPHQDLISSTTYYSNEPQSLNSFLSSSKRIYSHQQLGAKVEMVYSLLSMLDTNNREDISKTFLAMSSSADSCHAMRQSGCLPLLIQLIHSSELDKEVRERAAEALHNIVHSQTDEKRRKREIRVLKLLQQVREYCDELKNIGAQETFQLQESEKHPINAIGTLMKFSFDAEHRQAICILGGLHAISELIQVDHETHANISDEAPCITLRRYAGMSLTNLTFGDCKNKALLCSFNKFMSALVDQLKSPCEDLRQVTASVLRNLSWRADSESKQALRNVGAVTALTISAMEAKKESTLKSILSALWNLSAHCSLNKIDICSVPGALAFLVKMLKYKSSSNTLAIIENAGGILRNISSHVAVREDYRQILRENCCFEVLLEQLKSPSLTIVSNACGTLWNLSARCPEDQRRLWEMGATSMLRSLVQSKHKMISMGSSAALKNLLTANPNENLLVHLDSTAKSLGLQNLPTLFVRKKRALEQELNITLAETCENIDSIESPTHFNHPQVNTAEVKKANGPRRSESRDSVQTTKSDSAYERINQITLKNEEKLLEDKNITLHDSLDEKSTPRKLEDQKLMRRYKSSMIPTPTFKKVNQDRINEKTREESTGENNDAAVKPDVKVNSISESKKNGIPTLTSKLSGVKIHCHEISNDQCSSLNNFFSSSSDEEFLVTYKENNSLEAEGIENFEKGQRITDTVFKSVFYEESASSDLNGEENVVKKSNCHINGVIKNGKEFDGNEKIKEEQESLRNSKDLYLPVGLMGESGKNSFEKIRTTSGSSVVEKYDEKVNENGVGRKITQDGSHEGEFSGNGCLSFLEVHNNFSQYKSNNRNFNFNDSTLCGGKGFLVKCREQSSKVSSLSADDLQNGSVSDCFNKNIYEKLPTSNPLIPTSKKSSKFQDSLKELTLNERNKIMKNSENQSSFLSENHQSPTEGQCEPNKTSDRDTRIPIQEKRHGEDSQILSADSINSCHQTFNQSVSLSEVEDIGSQSEKATPGVMDSTETESKDPASPCYFSTESNRVLEAAEAKFPKPNEIALPLDSVKGVLESASNARDELDAPGAVTVDGVHLKALSGAILPKFKVGSPISDSKILQMEANKICREIRKQQELEMGCSLTSEVSLVSCSSFLDTGDYSLFDSSNDAVDFDESENLDFGKVYSRFKSPPLRKPATSQAAESVSLPSLGSLKNEQSEVLDLDSSILSVASISSEIAETCSKDFGALSIHTKTYEIDVQNENLEDTLADPTLVSNGEDTLNAVSVQNNPELFDDDNSLHSQENLPLDAEDFEEAPTDRMKKKLTPKERRKTFHERYRTYTIRTFNDGKSSGVATATSCQGVKANLKKDEVCVSCVQNGIQHHCTDTDLTHQSNSFASKIEDEVEEVNEGKQEVVLSSRAFCPDSEHKTFLFSTEFAREQDLTSRFAVDSKSLNDLMTIGPAERKELVDNAKLVAFSLKTAVQDCEMVSDCETEGPHVDINTATYSKNIRRQPLDRFSYQGLQCCDTTVQHYDEPFQEEDLEKKGAKILKPNEKSEGNLMEIPKGIRGRRKPLYSSPQKDSLRTNGSPSNLPKASQMEIDAKKSLSYVPPTLHREGTFTKEDGCVSKKKNEIKSTKAIPVLHRNIESKNLSPARPVSGNKSGLITGNSKRAGDNQVSKIGRPLSTNSSKINERRPESDLSQRRSFSAEAGQRAGGVTRQNDFSLRDDSVVSTSFFLRDGAATTKRPASTVLISPKMRNSSSNLNVKAGNSTGNGSLVKSKNPTFQNLKSRSDASLNVVSCKDKGKQKTPKKEVTSKIASLWRKVEETKQKNKTSKDSRVWIGSEKNTTTTDEVLVIEQEEILDIPTRKIVHSLTCQALTDGLSTDFTSPERGPKNVQEVANYGGSEERRENIERRSIISAIVPPYNYSPPASETAPSKIKRVDNFRKGSVKVTTV